MLLTKKVNMVIEYIYFTNVFWKKLANMLLKQIDINTYGIK